MAMAVDNVVDSVELEGPLVLVPVRHHSPACAWQLERLLRAYRPTDVLIEGPEDGDPLIGELIDKGTKPPVALYCFVRPKGERPGYAGWYPFCEHSPEWVALRVGRELGADLAFIDLPSWRQAAIREPAAGRAKVNEYADHRLRHADFIRELCGKTGCRDFDELWDGLFESDGFERSPESFWRDIASYCAVVRATCSKEELAADGTLIREAHMAANIRKRRRDGARVVVVTGGLHRLGLLNLLSSPSIKSPALKPPPENERGCYLTVYGDRQLDLWRGYESGMPAPAFYRALWISVRTGAATEASHSAFLASMARKLRGEEGVSTSELVAAEQMARGLAEFRGRRRPTRSDILDAVRATWVKGAVHEARGQILDRVAAFMTGDRIGQVTLAAGSPPLVRDFHDEARRLKVDLKKTAAGAPEEVHRRVHLDIYSKPPHRERSSFLHRLVELENPYATLIAGPDFSLGIDLSRVRELWELSWHPLVEGRLIEEAQWGVTVEEAAKNHLLDRIQSGGGRLSAAKAVSVLTSALVMSFDDIAGDLVATVEMSLLREGDFFEEAQAFGELAHLLGYRPVLGAQRHPEIHRLTLLAYERATYLLDSLPGLSTSVLDRRCEQALGAIARLRHAVLARTIEGLDGALFFESLERVRDRLGLLPMLEGAVLGVLRQAGRIDDDVVLRALDATISSTAAGPNLPLGDFLRGLFLMARHAVTQGSGILEAVSRAIEALDQEKFMEALPGLRLAFTVFPPREMRDIVDWIDRRASGQRQTDRARSIDPAAVERIQSRLARFHKDYLIDRAEPAARETQTN